MAPNIYVVLDSNGTVDNSYLPGSWISGRVILNLSSPQKTRGLRLQFRGYDHVEFTDTKERRSGNPHHRHQTKVRRETVEYFNNVITLLGYPRGQSVSENELVVLNPGNSEFPFRIQVPNMILPTAIILNYGRTCYEISSYLDIVNWFDTSTPNFQILIKSLVVVNTPDLLRGVSINQEKIMGCFSNQGEIRSVISIEKQGYLPGETINITCKVTNISKNTTIYSIEASIKVKTVFSAMSSERHQSDKVCYIVYPQTFSPQSPAALTTVVQITIPNDTLCSRNNSRLISMQHFLKLKLNYGKFGSNIEHVLPIVIGNSLLDTQASQVHHQPQQGYPQPAYQQQQNGYDKQQDGYQQQQHGYDKQQDEYQNQQDEYQNQQHEYQNQQHGYQDQQLQHGYDQRKNGYPGS